MNMILLNKIHHCFVCYSVDIISHMKECDMLSVLVSLKVQSMSKSHVFANAQQSSILKNNKKILPSKTF